MSVAGGLPRAVERAVVARLRRAADLREERQPVARARRCPRERSASSARRCARAGIGPVVSHASYLINLATTEPGAAPAVDRGDGRRARSRRSARPARRRAAPGLLHGRQRGAGPRRSSPTALLDLLRARRRGKTMVLLEHTAGQGTSLGATFEQLATIIEQHERPPARRRLPRHLPSAGVRLRHLLAGGLCDDVHAVRPAGRLRAAEGVSPERLEEAARQPRRSPRAHRRGLPRPRAVPPAGQRPAVPRTCRCCSKRRKRRASATGAIEVDPLDEQESRARCGR